MKKVLPVIILLAATFSSIGQTNTFPLAGTWTLKAVETILADGSRVTDTAYGKNAKGILMIDANGQYSLQIFRPDRPKFISADKRKGTAEEYAAALLGMSTHIGHIKIDSINHLLQFNIDYAVFPNWDQTIQTRKFKLSDEVLCYEVPATAAGGTIAVSIWKRIRKK